MNPLLLLAFRRRAVQPRRDVPVPTDITATSAIFLALRRMRAPLLLLVGILGTWIVSIMPESITEVARLYILPAILGGVMVQLVATLKQWKATAIAVGVALLVILLIVPNTPKLVSSFAIALCVILTVAVTWFTRDRSAHEVDEGSLIN